MSRMAEPPVEVTYSIAQVSKMTGVPRSSIDDARRAGRIRAYRLPGFVRGWRIPRSEVVRAFGTGATGGPGAVA